MQSNAGPSTPRLTRRDVLQAASAASAAVAVTGAGLALDPMELQAPWFRISLAEWSLHRTLRSSGAERITNLEFPGVAKGLGIDGVEYVNAFFGAVDAAKVMKKCDGYAIAEWFEDKDKLSN